MHVKSRRSGQQNLPSQNFPPPRDLVIPLADQDDLSIDMQIETGTVFAEKPYARKRFEGGGASIGKALGNAVMLVFRMWF